MFKNFRICHLFCLLNKYWISRLTLPTYTIFSYRAQIFQHSRSNYFGFGISFNTLTNFIPFMFDFIIDKLWVSRTHPTYPNSCILSLYIIVISKHCLYTHFWHPFLFISLSFQVSNYFFSYRCLISSQVEIQKIQKNKNKNWEIRNRCRDW